MNNDYAEPGMLFWDRIESYSLLSNDGEFQYAGVNPCAEEPLPAGGSCLLGSLNLAAFVGKDGSFKFGELQEAVQVAVTALNEVLDGLLVKTFPNNTVIAIPDECAVMELDKESAIEALESLIRLVKGE